MRDPLLQLKLTSTSTTTMLIECKLMLMLSMFNDVVDDDVVRVPKRLSFGVGVRVRRLCSAVQLIRARAMLSCVHPPLSKFRF
jgi:hypothetical protein